MLIRSRRDDPPNGVLEVVFKDEAGAQVARNVSRERDDHVARKALRGGVSGEPAVPQGGKPSSITPEPEGPALILESLLAFKRAGATGVLTYHAVDAARLIA